MRHIDSYRTRFKDKVVRVNTYRDAKDTICGTWLYDHGVSSIEIDGKTIPINYSYPPSQDQLSKEAWEKRDLSKYNLQEILEAAVENYLNG